VRKTVKKKFTWSGSQTRCHVMPWWGRMSDFSFLCTFVPGSEKSTDGTFILVELPFRGTFASWNFRSCGTFHSSGANVPRAFANCSLELSFLWNFCSFRTNRLLQELSLQASKKQSKAVAIQFAVAYMH